MPDAAPKSAKKRVVGCDFDGTLATYEGYKGHDVLGEPVPEMVKKVKQVLAEGGDVYIFTARVNPVGHSSKASLEATQATLAIAQWCVKNIGVMLPITHEKMIDFSEIWDDRAKEVIPSTGVFLSELMEATK